MRALAAFLLIAALAIVMALVAKANPGYVQFVVPPVRAEVSFFVFLLLALAAPLAVWMATVGVPESTPSGASVRPAGMVPTVTVHA